jgi:hypothetical protein
VIEGIKTDFSGEVGKLREELDVERQTKAKIMTWYDGRKKTQAKRKKMRGKVKRIEKGEKEKTWENLDYRLRR